MPYRDQVAFEIKDFSFGVENPTSDTLDFKLTTEPTAPGEDVMCQNNLRTGDDFIIVDYKPTESLAVDPNNPNVEWPIGPIPEFQDDGLLLPAVRMESGDGGFADGHNDGGLIINWLPGPDVNDSSTNPSNDKTPGPDDNVVELLGQPATETLTIAHEGFL